MTDIDVHRLMSLMDADDDPYLLLRAASKIVCHAGDGLRAAGYDPLREAEEIIKMIEEKGAVQLSLPARAGLPIARGETPDAVWSHYLAVFGYLRMVVLQLRPGEELTTHLASLATYTCDCVAQAFSGRDKVDDYYSVIWAEERAWQENCLEAVLGIKQYGAGTRLRQSLLAERTT